MREKSSFHILIRGYLYDNMDILIKRREKNTFIEEKIHVKSIFIFKL